MGFLRKSRLVESSLGERQPATTPPGAARTKRFLAAVAAAVFLVSGWALTASGQTLVVGIELDATTFYTPRLGGTPTLRVAEQIYDRLVNTNPDGSYDWRLATGHEVSSDLKTWSFTLREGVRFHDGTPFNAEAVAANYELIMGPDSLVGAAFSGVIESVTVTGEYSIQFNLRVPRVSFIEEFVAENRAFMMSPAAVAREGQDYGRRPVGTGPFKFVEWVSDDRIVLSRNDDYWAGSPLLEGIVFRPIPDLQTMMIELETGNIHVATRISPDYLETLRANPNITLISDPTLTYRAVYFNVNRPPFDDLAVRRAIVLAVDMDTIVESLGGALVVRTQGPINPSIWAWDPTISEPAYDPVLAAQVLTEAGWSKGTDGVWQRNGARLSVEILTPVGRWTRDHEMVEAATQYLVQFGVEARPRPMEWAAFLDTVMQRRDFDITMWGAGPLQPDPALSSLEENFSTTGTWNPAGFSDPELDRLLAEAASTTNVALRTELYSEAQHRFMAHNWTIGMFTDVDYVAVRREVQGHRFVIGRTRADYTGVSLVGN